MPSSGESAQKSLTSELCPDLRKKNESMQLFQPSLMPLQQRATYWGVSFLIYRRLHPTVRSVVARYRKSHRQTTYSDVSDFAQHEGDAIRARTSTPQSTRLLKRCHKQQSAALLQYPRDNGTDSTFSFFFSRLPAEVLESVVLLQPDQHAPKFESSMAPSMSALLKKVLALSWNTVTASRLLLAKRRT